MKQRKTPQRTCVGCGETKNKTDLIRVAAYEGELKLDPTGKAPGRGVYICPCRECLEKAVRKKGFNRSLKCNIETETLTGLEQELEEYLKKNNRNQMPEQEVL